MLLDRARYPLDLRKMISQEPLVFVLNCTPLPSSDIEFKRQITQVAAWHGNGRPSHAGSRQIEPITQKNEALDDEGQERAVAPPDPPPQPPVSSPAWQPLQGRNHPESPTHTQPPLPPATRQLSLRLAAKKKRIRVWYEVLQPRLGEGKQPLPQATPPTPEVRSCDVLKMGPCFADITIHHTSLTRWWWEWQQWLLVLALPWLLHYLLPPLHHSLLCRLPQGCWPRGGWQRRLLLCKSRELHGCRDCRGINTT